MEIMENQTMENLGLIKIGEGVFCRVNNVVVDCDIVDANGNLLEKDGVKQAPHSHIELTGSDLVGLDLPVQVVANKVYGLEG